MNNKDVSKNILIKQINKLINVNIVISAILCYGSFVNSLISYCIMSLIICYVSLKIDKINKIKQNLLKIISIISCISLTIHLELLFNLKGKFLILITIFGSILFYLLIFVLLNSWKETIGEKNLSDDKKTTNEMNLLYNEKELNKLNNNSNKKFIIFFSVLITFLILGSIGLMLFFKYKTSETNQLNKIEEIKQKDKILEQEKQNQYELQKCIVIAESKREQLWVANCPNDNPNCSLPIQKIEWIDNRYEQDIKNCNSLYK